MAKKIDQDKLFLQELREKILSPSGVSPYVILVSDPPIGKCKITNFYYDPAIDKVVWEYDDQPVGG